MEIHYGNYTKLDPLKFSVDLKNAFSHEKAEWYIKFDGLFMKILDRNTHQKENTKSQFTI